MDLDSMADRLASEKISASVTLWGMLQAASQTYLYGLLDMTGKEAKRRWRGAQVVGQNVTPAGDTMRGVITLKVRPKNVFYDVNVAVEYIVSPDMSRVNATALIEKDGRWSRPNMGTKFRSTDSSDKIVGEGLNIAESLLSK